MWRERYSTADCAVKIDPVITISFYTVPNYLLFLLSYYSLRLFFFFILHIFPDCSWSQSQTYRNQATYFINFSELGTESCVDQFPIQYLNFSILSSSLGHLR